MTREARDAAFDTSDGSAIAFTLHGEPRTGAPRLALIHSLALDRHVWDGVATTMGSDVELLTYECRDRISSELLTVLRRS